jgi:hypothetical protein
MGLRVGKVEDAIVYSRARATIFVDTSRQKARSGNVRTNATIAHPDLALHSEGSTSVPFRVKTGAVLPASNGLSSV